MTDDPFLHQLSWVAACFTQWRVCPHIDSTSDQVLKIKIGRIRPHIDSTNDQVLKIYLSLTEKRSQRCAGETSIIPIMYFH